MLSNESPATSLHKNTNIRTTGPSKRNYTFKILSSFMMTLYNEVVTLISEHTWRRSFCRTYVRQENCILVMSWPRLFTTWGNDWMTPMFCLEKWYWMSSSHSGKYKIMMLWYSWLMTWKQFPIKKITSAHQLSDICMHSHWTGI